MKNAKKTSVKTKAPLRSEPPYGTAENGLRELARPEPPYGSGESDLKELAGRLCDRLETLYPEAVCTLDAVEGWQLLFSTRLAAQCTDVRVNIVAEELFSVYPTIEAMADADLSELERIIKPCGLFKTKARDLLLASQMLRDEYGSVVPDSMEELLKLPGIGRKTANLVLGDYFGKPAVVTDTHCIRLTNRFGLVSTRDPAKVEDALWKLLDPARSNDFCHRTVLHGRAVCTARSPKCGQCGLSDLCGKVGVE